MSFPSLEFSRATLVFHLNDKIKDLESKRLRMTTTEEKLRALKVVYDALRLSSQDKITLTFEEYEYYVYIDKTRE